MRQSEQKGELHMKLKSCSALLAIMVMILVLTILLVTLVRRVNTTPVMTATVKIETIAPTATPTSQPTAQPAPVVPEVKGATTNFSSILTMFNEQRRQAGVAPVRQLGLLTSGAYRRARYLVTSGQWSHAGINEAIGGALGHPTYGQGGEDIARGFNTEADVIIGWMKSPTHKAVMLNPAYIYGGVGMYQGTYVLWLATAYSW